jgi:hypothetical protein
MQSADKVPWPPELAPHQSALEEFVEVAPISRAGRSGEKLALRTETGPAGKIVTSSQAAFGTGIIDRVPSRIQVPGIGARNGNLHIDSLVFPEVIGSIRSRKPAGIEFACYFMLLDRIDESEQCRMFYHDCWPLMIWMASDRCS